MKLTHIPASSRGHAHHGWLNTYHSFSFANYYDPSRMNFGVLRVLNDDTVSGGMGFGKHPHDNMEIISIPLSGSLEHEDSMGNTTVIRTGEIQIMSAGTGVAHSEKNHSATDSVAFLQIWIIPQSQNTSPRYDQIPIPANKNQWNQILSPNKNDAGVWINQQAYFSITHCDKDISLDYKLQDPDNGVYLFILDGSAQVADYKLVKRDALTLEDVTQFETTFKKNSRILLMEVPMQLP